MLNFLKLFLVLTVGEMLSTHKGHATFFKLNKVTAQFDLCDKKTGYKKTFDYKNFCMGPFCTNVDFATFMEKAEAELKNEALDTSKNIRADRGDTTISETGYEVNCKGLMCDLTEILRTLNQSSCMYCNSDNTTNAHALEAEHRLEKLGSHVKFVANKVKVKKHHPSLEKIHLNSYITS